MFCRKCGGEIEKDSLFCHKCGERVVLENDECASNESGEKRAIQEENRKKNSNKVIISVLMAVVLGICGVFGFDYYQEAQDKARREAYFAKLKEEDRNINKYMHKFDDGIHFKNYKELKPMVFKHFDHFEGRPNPEDDMVYFDFYYDMNNVYYNKQKGTVECFQKMVKTNAAGELPPRYEITHLIYDLRKNTLRKPIVMNVIESYDIKPKEKESRAEFKQIDGYVSLKSNIGQSWEYRDIDIIRETSFLRFFNMVR